MVLLGRDMVDHMLLWLYVEFSLRIIHSVSNRYPTKYGMFSVQKTFKFRRRVCTKLSRVLVCIYSWSGDMGSLCIMVIAVTILTGLVRLGFY